MMATNPTVKANQRRMIANTLKAGNKLTDAQKKQFSAAEIASIRKSVKAGTFKSPGADTKIHKSPGAPSPRGGRARSAKKATATKKAGSQLKDATGKGRRRGTPPPATSKSSSAQTKKRMKDRRSRGYETRIDKR